MAQAKKIYIFIIKVHKLFFFFLSWCFPKEKENMFSVFLSSYSNTSDSLGELEKAMETLAGHVPTAFLILSDFYSWLIRNTTETWYMFSIS